MKIDLNEIIDPMEAKIVVETGADGQRVARFDLAGLPRVDRLLVGKGVVEAVSMTEHLCGICPVAHHLAGNRALDQLVGAVVMPGSRADLQRRLLHYGSLVEAHSLRFVMLAREAGVTLKRLSRLMLNAAGSPGHFPVTALPGGVGAAVDSESLESLVAALPGGIAAAHEVLKSIFADSHENSVPASGEEIIGGGLSAAQLADADCAGAGRQKTLDLSGFAGADVALVDQEGSPDVYGTRVRAVRAGQLLFECEFAQWSDQIAETAPGMAAPRPYLREYGPQQGLYRVGPVSQLSVGELNTPGAAAAQQRWWENNGGALAARAVMTLHVLERTVQLCQELSSQSPQEAILERTVQLSEGCATGLVDGPRGILAHTYQVDAAGTIIASTILTPTAQNEPWLANLLTQAASGTKGGDLVNGIVPDDTNNALEQSIREADPCLPISSAPAGQMHLKLDIVRENSTAVSKP